MSPRNTGNKGVSKNGPGEPDLNLLYDLYHQGNLRQAMALAVRKLSDFPHSLTLNKLAGDLAGDLGEFDVAVNYFRRVIEIAPNDGETFFKIGMAFQLKGDNAKAAESFRRSADILPREPLIHKYLGITLHALGDAAAAEVSFRAVQELLPNDPEAHKNVGVALNAIGKRQEAVKSFEKALALKPDYPEALNDLGLALKESGAGADAIDKYLKALALDPTFENVQLNLIEVLTEADPPTANSHPIVLADQRIRALSSKVSARELTNEAVIDFLVYGAKLLASSKIDINENWSQAFKQNNIDLNCGRHMAIFNRHNVIPACCFGCYKVIVSPTTVINLVKLFFIFDMMKLKNNNTRKCIVELRSAFKGAYKGFIYCSSIDEATEVSAQLKALVDDYIDTPPSVSIKRGCSEYSLAYPGFEKAEKDTPSTVSYDEVWGEIEHAYDAEHPSGERPKLTPTLGGASLRDFLVIQNWLAYARGIGDLSAEEAGACGLGSAQVFEMAKTRI